MTSKLIPVVECECGQPMSVREMRTTLVGADSHSCPLGHVHDDNCRHYVMVCPADHRRDLKPRMVCECGWKGKSSCFCHLGAKDDIEWRRE